MIEFNGCSIVSARIHEANKNVMQFTTTIECADRLSIKEVEKLMLSGPDDFHVIGEAGGKPAELIFKGHVVRYKIGMGSMVLDFMATGEPAKLMLDGKDILR